MGKQEVIRTVNPRADNKKKRLKIEVNTRAVKNCGN